MRKITLSTLIFFVLFNSIGCMTSYLFHTGYNHAKLMNSRKPIADVIKDPNTPLEIKEQLQEVLKVREFATQKLNLKVDKNYLDYVDLKRPYVTWAVTAAKAWKLEQHQWSFPIVGKVPYLGFFTEDLADKEAKKFDPKEYDTTVRGISAFSTLGWFSDPVLSSMITKEKHDLINIIIHESIHATLYIPGDADFNEQVATYMGDWGSELYYKEYYPQDKITAKKISDENYDRRLFSQFLSQELKLLTEWYDSLDSKLTLEMRSEQKQARLLKIKEAFSKNVLPKMKTKNYSGFVRQSLNNATLLGMKTYFEDWADLENLHKKQLGNTPNDFVKMLDQLKELKKHDKPKERLKELSL